MGKGALKTTIEGSTPVCSDGSFSFSFGIGMADPAGITFVLHPHDIAGNQGMYPGSENLIIDGDPKPYIPDPRTLYIVQEEDETEKTVEATLTWYPPTAPPAEVGHKYVWLITDMEKNISPHWDGKPPPHRNFIIDPMTRTWKENPSGSGSREGEGSPSDPIREFIFYAAFDTNHNNVVDLDDPQEATRELNITILKENELVLSETTNPDNMTEIEEPGNPEGLTHYIGQDRNEQAKLDITLKFLPENANLQAQIAQFGDRFLWKLERKDGDPANNWKDSNGNDKTEGDFSGGKISLIWTDPDPSAETANRKFTIDAGYDKDHNTILEESEYDRQLDLVVVKIHKLTIYDLNNKSNMKIDDEPLPELPADQILYIGEGEFGEVIINFEIETFPSDSKADYAFGIEWMVDPNGIPETDWNTPDGKCSSGYEQINTWLDQQPKELNHELLRNFYFKVFYNFDNHDIIMDTPAERQLQLRFMKLLIQPDPLPATVESLNSDMISVVIVPNTLYSLNDFSFEWKYEIPDTAAHLRPEGPEVIFSDQYSYETIMVDSWWFAEHDNRLKSEVGPICDYYLFNNAEFNYNFGSVSIRSVKSLWQVFVEPVYCEGGDYYGTISPFPPFEGADITNIIIGQNIDGLYEVQGINPEFHSFDSFTPIVCIVSTSEFYDKIFSHESVHVDQFENQIPWMNLWNVEHFYNTVLLNLEKKRDEVEFTRDVEDALVSWLSSQNNTYCDFFHPMEIPAINAGNLIPPHYLEIGLDELEVYYPISKCILGQADKH